MLKKELQKFLVVGLITVFIDYCVYMVGLQSGLPIATAKAFGFIAGAIFAYITNRLITFRSHQIAGKTLRAAVHSYLSFILLYLGTLGVNVTTNAVFIFLGHWIKPYVWADCPDKLIIWAAFMGATGLSAALNFLGMKFFVFKTGGTTHV